MKETDVLIVGAGPSGLATSACLKQFSIPNLILEREDCHSSLWKKRTYDRLGIHLAKEFCSLPLAPHPKSCPVFMSKNDFISYMDDYVSRFELTPSYNRSVVSARYCEEEKRWCIEVENLISGEICWHNCGANVIQISRSWSVPRMLECNRSGGAKTENMEHVLPPRTNKIEAYKAEFLVVATGENDEGFIPETPGLEGFKGEVLHSSLFKNGSLYKDKRVLVVGCGNSGMEIAYDLSTSGANTFIVIKSPCHVLSKEMVRLGMTLLHYLPVQPVDFLVTKMANFKYGDLSRYGIARPKEGPFYIKAAIGRSAIIDVGTVDKIKAGKIEIVPGISSVNEHNVLFDNGDEKEFDAIVFATGYKSVANYWLKDFKYVLGENGMPKNKFPNHWKGEKNSYCAGLSKRGLLGISMDARAIVNDIKTTISLKKDQQ